MTQDEEFISCEQGSAIESFFVAALQENNVDFTSQMMTYLRNYNPFVMPGAGNIFSNKKEIRFYFSKEDFEKAKSLYKEIVTIVKNFPPAN
jgi:hypothetical protein